MNVKLKLNPTTRELILGGQRSGKSRRAEDLTGVWLAQSVQHTAVFVATAQAWDEEMQSRILRHQADRAARLPRMRTVEECFDLAAVIRLHSAVDCLIVVDCLTLWLTNWLMPAPPAVADVARMESAEQDLLDALASAAGPVVLVSNEIGLGVIPIGFEVREFVDRLGRLNQSVARVCTRVNLMAAGLALGLKDDDLKDGER